jgi:hypothetical protein
MTEELTPAQHEASTRAYELLSEHFDGFFLITIADRGDHAEIINHSYYGGSILARGLIVEAQERMHCTQKRGDEEP